MRLKFVLFLVLILSLVFESLSAEDVHDHDPELNLVLGKLEEEFKTKKRPSIISEKFPTLPTDDDIVELEKSLFNEGWKLPNSLKEYHLKFGNLGFSLDFPTIHRLENGDKYRSHLSDFVRDGHEKGVPESWMPFCQAGSDYVCMELETGKIGYFYFSGSSKLKKDKGTEYQNFSTWLKERLKLNLN